MTPRTRARIHADRGAARARDLRHDRGARVPGDGGADGRRSAPVRRSAALAHARSACSRASSPTSGRRCRAACASARAASRRGSATASGAATARSCSRAPVRSSRSSPLSPGSASATGCADDADRARVLAAARQCAASAPPSSIRSWRTSRRFEHRVPGAATADWRGTGRCWARTTLPRAVRLDADARRRRADRPLVRAAMNTAGRALAMRAGGAALMLAMLVAALAATVAVALAAEQQRWFADVGNRRDQVQAQALALAGVQWARQIINDDARGGPLDHLGRDLGVSAARHADRERLDRGPHRGRAGPLNLNNLALAGAQGTTERMRVRGSCPRQGVDAGLRRRGRRLGRRRRTLRARAAPRTRTTRSGRRRRSPRTLRWCAPPRWRRSAGASAQAWAALADDVIAALPAGAALNINTASDRRAHRGLPRARRRQARGVRRRPRAQAVHDDGRAARTPAARRHAPEAASFAFASSYFLVSVRSRQGEAIAQARALLKRDGREWPVGRLADARVARRPGTLVARSRPSLPDRHDRTSRCAHRRAVARARRPVGAVRRAGARRAVGPRRARDVARRRIGAEAVLAAAAVRLAAVTLPPMPRIASPRRRRSRSRTSSRGLRNERTSSRRRAGATGASTWPSCSAR